MKSGKVLTASLCIAAYFALPAFTLAGEAKSNAAAAKPKPYLLKTCIVSDEKLGGDMGKPYVFTYQDREIKLCCKSCLTDFNKNPAKYIKKLEAAEKKAAKKS